MRNTEKKREKEGVQNRKKERREYMDPESDE